jgi:DNA-directed RNA polymerase I, II, and III subunit RPABC2
MSYFDDKLYGGDGDEDLDRESSDDESTSSSDENTTIRKKHLKNNLEDDDDINNEDIEDDDNDIEDDDEDIDDDDEDIDVDEAEEDDDEDEADDDDSQKMIGGDGDEEGSDDGSKTDTKQKRVKKIPAKVAYVKSNINSDSDNENDSDDDEDGEQYLQKFDKSINQNYIVNFHPESVIQNYDEISAMCKVVRDDDGVIIDDLHKTIPYLTKYEKARILGQRAKQINSGSPPFVKVPENVIDGYIIAELELKEKRIPFIIRRPLPNGGSEYWSIKDLEDISF